MGRYNFTAPGVAEQTFGSLTFPFRADSSIVAVGTAHVYFASWDGGVWALPFEPDGEVGTPVQVLITDVDASDITTADGYVYASLDDGSIAILEEVGTAPPVPVHTINDIDAARIAAGDGVLFALSFQPSLGVRVISAYDITTPTAATLLGVAPLPLGGGVAYQRELIADGRRAFYSDSIVGTYVVDAR